MFLLILIGGLAYSCQNRPKEVLGRKQMERLMYDVYIAEATMENDYANFNTPEKKEAYIHKIFKEHKISPAQWDSSLAWYSDRINIYLKMNDSVKVRLQRTRQEVEALVAQNQANQTNQSLLQDSYIPPFYAFSMPNTIRGFRFRLDSPDISSKIEGDDFAFTFSVIGIPPRFSSSFTSLLTLIYADTTIYRYEQIKENKTYELTGSKYITGDTLNIITGFVHLHDSTGVIPHIQLYNISLHARTLFLETDTLKMVPDSIEGEPLDSDTLKLTKLVEAKPLKPDSILQGKKDSIRQME